MHKTKMSKRDLRDFLINIVVGLVLGMTLATAWLVAT